MLYYIHNFVRIEIKTHNGVVTLRLLGLLFYTQTVPIFVKLSNAVTFRVVHPIPKYRCLPIIFCRINSSLKHACKTTSVENVITKHKASRIVANEFFSNDKCLCKSVRRRLLCVFEMHSVIRSITKQTFKSWQIIRSANNENIPNSC